MHSRRLILTLSAVAASLALTAAYADTAPIDAASSRIALQQLGSGHLTPKPAPVMVGKSGASAHTGYGSLEFGLLTIGTLTTSTGLPSAK